MTGLLSSCSDVIDDVLSNGRHVDVGADRRLAERALKHEAIPARAIARKSSHALEGKLGEIFLAVRACGHHGLRGLFRGILA
jgi:hypothetical protein